MARRQIIVGAAAFAAVFAVWLFYLKLSRPERIAIAPVAEPKPPAPKAGSESPHVGTVGQVGVGNVGKAVFTELDDHKRVAREFGFNKLLHKEGRMWDLEGPYMNIYRDGFDSYITANSGSALVEEIAGRPRLKELVLSGDVVVRMVRAGSPEDEQSYLYLDDVSYIESESRFFTEGPVRFVSAEAELTGTGLDVVYNDDVDRLGSLRLADLDILLLKNAAYEKPRSPGSAAEYAPSSDDGAVTDAPAPAAPSVGEPIQADRDGLYRCVFRGHVKVESPGQVVLTEILSINRFMLEMEAPSASAAEPAPEPAPAGPAAEDPQTGGGEVEAARQPEVPGNDIMVTCRKGLWVTPMEDDRFLRAGAGAVDDLWKEADDPVDGDKSVFTADRIDVDYHGKLGDITATGRSRLGFFVDMNSPSAGEGPVPVSVTAQKAATYEPAANSVLFEDDCVATMVRMQESGRTEYILAAPRLLVELSKEHAQSPRYFGGMRSAVADGGGVRLETVKTKDGDFAGGCKLKCRRFDYDGLNKCVLATGNGMIAMDNSRLPGGVSSEGRFSLKKPCYAVVRNFDLLKYFIEPRTLSVRSDNERMLIDYFTVAGGEYNRQVFVTAQSLEAVFSTSQVTELIGLKASGGVSYEEEGVQFEGSEFVYDSDSSTITAGGSGRYPAYCNGAVVDKIEYDLASGGIRTSIRGPGQLEGR